MQTIYRCFFFLGQRLLALWVRVKASGDVTLENTPNIRYVLENTSLSDAMVLASYCDSHNLPHHAGFVRLPRRRRSRGYPTSRNHSVLPVDAGEGITLQPVSVYWGRAPERERSLWKILFADTWAVTGVIGKLLTIIVNGRETRLHFGQPIALAELLERQQGDVNAAQNELEQKFLDYRSGIIGPDLSHRRTVVRDILLSASVRDAIKQEATLAVTAHAKPTGEAKLLAEKQAAKYANEIASDFSYSTARVVFLLLYWVWTRLYKGVSVYHNQQLTDLASRYSLVYVPCHRSHIDSFLLGYSLHVNQLPTPHFAAGINMNMPVIGGLLRRVGAFFLRRSFKDNPLYKAVFSEYLHSMFSKGFPIAYYVEGGRSRSGRTLPPKAGMLSMTVRSYLRSPARPIAFVPVYAAYEKIIEERSYLGELRGSHKKGESLWGALASTRHLFSKFGRVYLNFGQAIVLDEVLDAHQATWREQAFDDKADWIKLAVNDLASLVGQRINQAAVVNGVNLTALALLATPRQAMDESRLLELLQLYHDLMAERAYSADVVLAESSPTAMLAAVESLGLIERIPNALGDILRLQGTEAVLMSYYRNNILHLFALPGLIAALFRHYAQWNTEQILQACHSLYPWLQAELHLPWNKAELTTALKHWLKTLEKHGLLLKSGDDWRGPAADSNAAQQLILLGDNIRPTMERFQIVMAVLDQTGGRTDNAEKLADQCQLVGQRLAALHGFNAPEFFDPILFKAFISLLSQMGVLLKEADGSLSLSKTGVDVSRTAGLILDRGILANIALLSAESAQRKQTKPT